MSLTALVRIVDEKPMVREVVVGYVLGADDDYLVKTFFLPRRCPPRPDLDRTTARRQRGFRARHCQLTERKLHDRAR